MRTPFTLAEEILDRGDRPSQPQVPGFEIRVSGSIDVHRLRDAVAQAVSLHPMARARKARRRRFLRPPEWEIADAASLDLTLAVRSADASSEQEMSAIRARFYSAPISLSRPPAVRLLVVRRAGGDSLCLKWHHAIADGVGGLRLLQSIARAYTGIDDPIPALDPITARAAARSNNHGSQTRPDDHERESLVGEPTTLVAPEPDRAPGGYGVHHLTLDADAVDLRGVRGVVPTASVNDVLIAALHKTIEAWNAEHGRGSGRIIVMVPANNRPVKWLHEVVANVVRLDVVTTTDEQRAGIAPLLESVVAQTRSLKRPGGVVVRSGWRRRLAPVLLLVATIPAVSRRRQAAALLSTMGRIKRPPDFGPAGHAIEFWGFTPIPMPPGLGVGVVGLGDRYHVAFCYRRILLDATACERFATIYERELTAITCRQPDGAQSARTTERRSYANQ